MDVAPERKPEQVPASPEPVGLSIIMNARPQKMADELQAITNFQTMVQKQLKSNQDYGVIPGTQKPTLLKPGAEKIQMLMGVSSQYDITDKVEDYDEGFFDYTIKCTLYKGQTKLTEGLGSANTKESKYVSRDGFSMKNTVLKMAKKRAQIDATLTIASLSNVFTQDIEDTHDFNQREQVETMNSGDANSMKVTFGKHKGETLGEIAKSDKSYVEWLAEKGRDEAMRKAAKMVLNPQQDKQENSQSNSNMQNNNPINQNLQNRIDLIVGYSKKIAKASGVNEQVPANEVMKQMVQSWTGSADDWNALTLDQATHAVNALQKMIDSANAKQNVPNSQSVNDPFASAGDEINISDEKLPFAN